MAFPTTGISQLLARHGRDIRLTYSNVNNEYNPETGEVTTKPVSSVIVRGYFYDTKKEPNYETVVDEGKRRVVFRPIDSNGLTIKEPQPGDSIVGQRDKVHILRVEEIVSQMKTLFYICIVKE